MRGTNGLCAPFWLFGSLPVVPQAEVVDVRREADGAVAAYTNAAVPSGAEVQVSIDWANRFDLMQQHTGMRGPQ